jgi:hypothetical protein
MFFVVIFFLLGIASVPFFIWVVLLLFTLPLFLFLLPIFLLFLLLIFSFLPKLAFTSVETCMMTKKVVSRFVLTIKIVIVFVGSFFTLGIIIWILIRISRILLLLSIRNRRIFKFFSHLIILLSAFFIFKCFICIINTFEFFFMTWSFIRMVLLRQFVICFLHFFLICFRIDSQDDIIIVLAVVLHAKLRNSVNE